VFTISRGGIQKLMAHVNILKFGVSSPADISPLKHLKAAGYDSSSILAVIGKSEGAYLLSCSCVGDWSKRLSVRSFEAA
jgi:cyanuric acid amidohydrolase